LLLHLEIVLDKGLDELVDAGIDGEAERLGARGQRRVHSELGNRLP
jgi:hypothetical protein